VTGRWFSPGPPVSSTNKTDRHNIAEILLKVALNYDFPHPEIPLFYPTIPVLIFRQGWYISLFGDVFSHVYPLESVYPMHGMIS
jgi:hypothetical protein